MIRDVKKVFVVGNTSIIPILLLSCCDWKCFGLGMVGFIMDMLVHKNRFIMKLDFVFHFLRIVVSLHPCRVVSVSHVYASFFVYR